VIGEALKMFRTIHGYKAKELAEHLDLSPSYLSEIENGKKTPSYDVLEKYAEVFDVKLSTLIIFTEDYAKNKHTGKAQNGIRKMLFNFMKRLDEEVADEDESESE
jgi:transcriptional regulator with XRE-family HTH domain